MTPPLATAFRLWTLRCAFAVPPAAAMLILAAIWIAESRGVVVIGAVPAADLAEAAATGAAATVVRLIGEGQEPTRVHTIRPEVLGLARMTPLEAAVLAEDLEMVQLLDRLHAIVGAERQRLACLAIDIENEPIARYLMPVGAVCESGVVVGEIRRRS
jgi:hypothetical protein